LSSLKHSGTTVPVSDITAEVQNSIAYLVKHTRYELLDIDGQYGWTKKETNQSVVQAV